MQVLHFFCLSVYTVLLKDLLREVSSSALTTAPQEDSIKPLTGTVIILRFPTDMPGQTVQTQIRLLLEEQQSDQCLHCLPFRLHRLDS